METMTLTVDGAPIGCGEFVYLMLNKPAGLLSATEDRKQQTVLDLLPDELRKRGVFPVGRLDKDTEGLLLLTDDGALAHRLLSPKNHVDKCYYAEVDGILTAQDVSAFAAGMTLGDGLHCLPARLIPLDGATAARITLHEGKFHQVKRMLAACGKPVTYLKRIEMAGLPLPDDLPSGQWRMLTQGEIQQLLQAGNGGKS